MCATQRKQSLHKLLELRGQIRSVFRPTDTTQAEILCLTPNFVYVPNLNQNRAGNSQSRAVGLNVWVTWVGEPNRIFRVARTRPNWCLKSYQNSTLNTETLAGSTTWADLGSLSNRVAELTIFWNRRWYNWLYFWTGQKRISIFGKQNTDLQQ